MSRADRRDAWIAALAGVAFLAVTLPWRYQGGSFGEPDSAGIAAGIRQAVLGGRSLHEPMLYLASGHPLYYLFFLRGSGVTQVDDIVALMSRVSWISMGGAVALVYVVCRRFARPGMALAATVAVASSPVTFELATYGHPVTPALLLFLLGGAALLDAAARGFPADARGVARTALAASLVAAAICTRADAVFFLPALVTLAHVVCPRRRTVVTAGLAAVAALAIYFAVRRIAPQEGVLGGNAAQQLRQFLAINYRLDRLRFGVGSFFFAAGPGLGLSIVAAVVTLVWRRAWAPLIYGACIVLPTFGFYVGNPLPSRHFLHAIFGCGFFLALAAPHLWPSRGAVRTAFVPAVAALNLALVPLTGAIAHATGWQLRCRLPGAKCWLAASLTQGVFERHRTNERYFAWDRARWERLLATRPEGALFIGTWLEQAGLRLFTSAEGHRLHRQQVTLGPDSEWILLSIDGLQVYFWMRSPDDDTSPPFLPPGPVHVVSPFAPADLARLPRGSLDAPAWAECHRSL